MAMNKALAGKSYPAQTYTVTEEAIQKYCYGLNETSPYYFDRFKDGGPISPPLFGIVFSLPATGAPLFDPDLGANIMRLVHGEQDMIIHRLARPGDEITTTGKILSIEEKGSGELITLESESKDKQGKPVLTAKAGYFIRGEKKGDGAKRDGGGEEPSNKKVAVSTAMEVLKDQSLRYAEGSGDRNPIHIDDSMGRMAGLPGIIIHGMCSLGLAVKGIVDKYLDTDPRKVRRISVRFSKIVLPKDTITTEGWVLEKAEKMTILGFETKNQRGEVVLKNGIFECENV